jgi:hypothetical protein
MCRKEAMGKFSQPVPGLCFLSIPGTCLCFQLGFLVEEKWLLHQSPTGFDVIASNDVECTAASDWVNIKEVRGVSWTMRNQEKSWDLDADVGYTLGTFRVSL